MKEEGGREQERGEGEKGRRKGDRCNERTRREKER